MGLSRCKHKAQVRKPAPQLQGGELYIALYIPGYVFMMVGGDHSLRNESGWRPLPVMQCLRAICGYATRSQYKVLYNIELHTDVLKSIVISYKRPWCHRTHIGREGCQHLSSWHAAISLYPIFALIVSSNRTSMLGMSGGWRRALNYVPG